MKRKILRTISCAFLRLAERGAVPIRVKNNICAALLFATAMASSTPASANGYVSARIAHISTTSSIVLIKMETSVPGKPACATNIDWDFAIPVSNQASYALLLSARLNAETILIAGAGACTTYGNVENIDYVNF